MFGGSAGRSCSHIVIHQVSTKKATSCNLPKRRSQSTIYQPMAYGSSEPPSCRAKRIQCATVKGLLDAFAKSLGICLKDVGEKRTLLASHRPFARPHGSTASRQWMSASAGSIPAHRLVAMTRGPSERMPPAKVGPKNALLLPGH
jgi:hypothetical protein